MPTVAKAPNAASILDTLPHHDLWRHAGTSWVWLTPPTCARSGFLWLDMGTLRPTLGQL